MAQGDFVGWVQVPITEAELMVVNHPGELPRILITAEALGRITTAWDQMKADAFLLGRLGRLLKPDPMQCSACGDRDPKLHPSVEGDDVPWCRDPWHGPASPPVDEVPPPPDPALNRVFRALLGWMELNPGQKLSPGKYSVSGFAPRLHISLNLPGYATSCDLTVRDDGAVLNREGQPAVTPSGYGLVPRSAPEPSTPAG